MPSADRRGFGARAWSRLRGRGPAATIRLAGRFLREAAAGLWFDRRHRIDTATRERPFPDTQGRDATRYEATPPREFRRVLRRLPLDPRDYGFIDLGCGKGRALLLASALGFDPVIGVEASPALAEVARRNLRARSGPAAPVQVFTSDAARFVPPPDPLVIYMFNPFGPDTMRAVAKRLAARPRRRPDYLVYRMPVWADLIEQELAPVILEADDRWRVYRLD